MCILLLHKKWQLTCNRMFLSERGLNWYGVAFIWFVAQWQFITRGLMMCCSALPSFTSQQLVQVPVPLDVYMLAKISKELMPALSLLRLYLEPQIRGLNCQSWVYSAPSTDSALVLSHALLCSVPTRCLPFPILTSVYFLPLPTSGSFLQSGNCLSIMRPKEMGWIVARALIVTCHRVLNFTSIIHQKYFSGRQDFSAIVSICEKQGF